MPTPFPFVSGQVLQAAQLNAITTLPINDQTASYALVVGDVGKRVVMNVASANTVTVNNSIFSTGDTIFIANKGAGTCTITAGAGVTINSASGLTLVQYQSGTLIALSASTFLFVKEDVTVSAGGLVYLTGATFTTVTSVSLPTNTFTSTYRNYRIILHITAAASDTAATVRLRAGGTDDSAASYRFAALGLQDNGTATNVNGAGTTSWQIIQTNTDPQPSTISFDLVAPQVATQTLFHGSSSMSNSTSGLIVRIFAGRFANTTQFDALSFLFAANTSGIYRVYGYADS